MSLETPTNKVPGTEIRRTPAPRPAFAGLLIVALTVIIWVLAGLVGWVIFVEDANSAAGTDPAIAEAPMGNLLKSEQQIISFWLAGIFFCLSFVVLLYQRYFSDHVTIAKRRFRKWEDEGVQL